MQTSQLELFNLTKIKDPAVMGTWIKENWHRIPPSIVDQLDLWYRWATELDFKPYCKAMRDDFRRLARRHPELPLDILISWIKATTDGFPAGVIVDLWLSELVSLKLYPEDNLKELQKGILNARAYLEHIWDGAVSIGRYLWSELSERRIIRRLNNYLADHTAIQI
jgi:hypothetical protein